MSGDLVLFRGPFLHLSNLSYLMRICYYSNLIRLFYHLCEKRIVLAVFELFFWFGFLLVWAIVGCLPPFDFLFFSRLQPRFPYFVGRVGVVEARRFESRIIGSEPMARASDSVLGYSWHTKLCVLR